MESLALPLHVSDGGRQLRHGGVADADADGVSGGHAGGFVDLQVGFGN
jgi:hypothetical protein